MKPAVKAIAREPQGAPSGIDQANAELEKMFGILKGSGRHKSFTASEFESLIACWSRISLCLRGPSSEGFSGSSCGLLRPARARDATHQLLVQLFRLSVVLGQSDAGQLHVFSAAQSAFIEFIQPYQSSLDQSDLNKTVARWKHRSGAQTRSDSTSNRPIRQ